MIKQHASWDLCSQQQAWGTEVRLRASVTVTPVRTAVCLGWAKEAAVQTGGLQRRIPNPTVTDRDDPGPAPEVKWQGVDKGKRGCSRSSG